MTFLLTLLQREETCFSKLNSDSVVIAKFLVDGNTTEKLSLRCPRNTFKVTVHTTEDKFQLCEKYEIVVYHNRHVLNNFK